MLAALALGSNLPSRFGDPAANLHEALHRLADLGECLAVSSFYQTDPVGLREQPRFTNAAALLRTPLAPLALLRALLGVESAMGRVRPADQPPKGPRLIDLDLLLYLNDGINECGTDEEGSQRGQNLILTGPELTLPHPSLHERRFVLAPLAEIAPDLVHPVLGRTVAELLGCIDL